MISFPRRRFVAAGLTVAGAALNVTAGGGLLRAQPSPRVVRITARRFAYLPAEVTLKKGEPVTIELTSGDVVMGFNAPDFGVRADIIPGQVSRVSFTPDKAGTFVFLCDIFCGDGHEGMAGKLHVTA
ncbi:MAG TPA: cupredoxin domain-containing protein [Burkholderiales bacterium]